MDHVNAQFFLNSVPIPFLAVRHAQLFASKPGRFHLMGFLFAAFLANVFFNLDRYALTEAVLRAGAFAAVIAVCIFGLSFFREYQRAKPIKTGSAVKAPITAADTPATPPDRAP